jgi:3-oxoacyl-[acyl-carrier-protein] synthase-3
MSVCILGTGSYLPRRVVTNEELAAVMDTSDEWIRQRTGIRERRYADEADSTSGLGASAGRAALDAAGLGPERIDALVVATSSPDYVHPATACAMQPKLGLGRVPAFDVNAVCTGFVYGLCLADGLMRANPDQYRRMLVVGSEIYSRYLDYEDRTSSVFFGDGAGAVCLGHGPAGYGILASQLYADGDLLDVVGVPAGGTVEPTTDETVRRRRHYFRMDGRRVWDFASTQLPQMVKTTVAAAGVDINDVAMFVLHQANARLVASCLESLGVPASRSGLTVPKYGNTAAASVPITLDEVVRAGRVRRGDLVVLAAVGGGMTAGAVLIRWF